MATIREVAKLAGVSSSTVSLTFNESHRVNADTARKVWKAAQQLGYHPNPLAQSLKRGRSKLIAFVVGDFSNPFFWRILKEMERIAKRSGYSIIVSETEADRSTENDLLHHLSAQRISGILLVPHGDGEGYAKDLLALGTPIVTLDHRVEGGEFDYVASDNHLAAAMLTEHLIRLGHRRIAQIAGTPRLWTAAERIRGFQETMQVAGIPEQDMIVVNGDYYAEPAYAQTMRLMTGPNRPTAILAANNVMALGALQALRELGIRCPDEVSLATIDDVPWSSMITPSLTFVQQDVQLLARSATNYLLERIEAGNQGGELPRRETILTPSLIVGESTAASAQRPA